MIHVRLTKDLQGTQGPFPLAVDLAIAERSLVALTGVSGTGKTTLLRMIAGLAEPDDGEIAVGDERWFDKRKRVNLKTQEREIGFVFQDYSLFPNMTVRENLDYAGSDKKYVDELLELVELQNLAHRYPHTLSGGQKQRVALVRAIVRRPKILLLDEPFSSLDPAMKIRLQDEIKKIHERYPITAILVSHDMAEMYKLATRLIVLDGGRIVRDGSPRQLLTNRETSHKFSFTGEIIDIRKTDIVYVVLIAAGNTISEVVLTEEDIRGLHPGDSVMAATKAFQPIVMKMG